MIIRLGYVSIALNLDKITSSSTLTYARYLKMDNEQERINKLKSVTYSNIEALEEILKYNIRNQIHFYRMTSNLIPLATHPEVEWDFLKYFQKDLEYIGKIIKDNNLRVDAHPDQFNVINSDRDSVVQATINNLKVQKRIFDAMKYDGLMVIHIGGAKGGKEEATNRFFENLKSFPKEISQRLILENDDKTYTTKEVLEICKKANLPMVLDIHHHNCNNEGECIKDMIKEIFDTWNNSEYRPKIHISSPREFEKDRKHADYITVEEFIEFIRMVKEVDGRDFDVMIEAKKKDLALEKLIEDIKEYESINIIDRSTIEL